MAKSGSATVIKRIEIVEGGGHHGGAWKVAYADFMTAMMAFFLLMWILSSSDEQKLRGIAEYFTNATMPGGSGVLDGATLGPPGTLNASNGATVARGSELGEVDEQSPAKWEVRDVTATPDPQEKVRGTTVGSNENPATGAAAKTYHSEFSDDAEAERAGAGKTEADENAAASSDGQKELNLADQAQFDKLQAEIMQAIQVNPDLKTLEKNVIFERTPEGLRIQLIDQEGRPMFRSGGHEMVKAAQILMKSLGQSIAQLPNSMVITGHTDSVPFSNRKSYDNWDLSTDRANATRRVLASTGVEPERVIRVSGKADTDPLLPDSRDDPSNRRITLLLQYRAVAPMNEHAQSHEPAEGSSAPEQDHAPAKKYDDHAHAAKTAPMEDHSEKVATNTTSDMTTLNDKTFEDLRNILR